MWVTMLKCSGLPWIGNKWLWLGSKWIVNGDGVTVAYKGIK